MSSLDEQLAALDFAPFAVADATGADGTMRVAVTAANGQHSVPSGMRGKFVDVYASVDVQYAFGTSAVTLAYNQVAAFGTGHVQSGRTLPAGVIKSFRVPSNAVHLAVYGAGAGFFEMGVSQRAG